MISEDEVNLSKEILPKLKDLQKERAEIALKQG